jgi:hypothetical protein
MGKIKCPKCGNTDVGSCPGGTCYKPSKEAMQNIKYICTNGDCLNEFGDNDLVCNLCGKPSSNGEHPECIDREKAIADINPLFRSK